FTLGRRQLDPKSRKYPQSGQSRLSFFKITQVQNTPARKGESTIQKNGICAKRWVDANVVNQGLSCAVPMFQCGFGVALQKVNCRQEVVRPSIRWIDTQRGCQMLPRLNKVFLAKCLAGESQLGYGEQRPIIGSLPTSFKFSAGNGYQLSLGGIVNQDETLGRIDSGHNDVVQRYAPPVSF